MTDVMAPAYIAVAAQSGTAPCLGRIAVVFEMLTDGGKRIAFAITPDLAERMCQSMQFSISRAKEQTR